MKATKQKKFAGAISKARAVAVGVCMAITAAALGTVAAQPAFAAYPTVTLNVPPTNLSYNCNVPIVGTATASGTLTGSITGPLYMINHLQPGSSFSFAGSGLITIPSNLLSTLESDYPTVGVNSVSVGVDAQGDVTETSQTVSVTSVNGVTLPTTINSSVLGTGLTSTLSPVTFKAGKKAGTAGFYPGDISIALTLAGTPASITCVPVAPLPEVGGVPLLIATSATTDSASVPVGFECNYGLIGNFTSASIVTGSVLPDPVAANGEISLSGSASLSVPAGVISALNSLGASSITVNSIQVGLLASGDVAQTAVTDSVTTIAGASLPATIPVSSLGSPITGVLSPATIMAGPTPGGVATLAPGDLNLSLNVNIGSLVLKNQTGSCVPTLSTTLDVVPVEATTVTTLTPSKSTITVGAENAETFTVGVTTSETTAVPTGPVIVKAGSTKYCRIILSGGSGSCTLTASQIAAAGIYKFKAVYAIEGEFMNSVSKTKAVTVAAAA